MAHLSPDTPAVDVTIDDPGTAEPPVVLDGLGYGDVSAYRTLPAGRYAVAVRAAGAGSAGPPVLSTTVDVAPGAARTVAVGGAFADLALSVLDDDLTAPTAGTARVRVVSGSAAGPLDVRMGSGPPVTTDPASGYTDVDPEASTARITPSGRTAVLVPLALEPGSVYTLLVLDDERGELTGRLVRDAAGPADAPVGGVAAGSPDGAPAGPFTRLVGRAAEVAAGATGRAPLRLRVPAIGVDAGLAAVVPDTTGTLGAPDDRVRAGWLASGPVPGEQGPAVVTGHVSYRGPAVFARLAELAPGSEVFVDRADGSTARFVVTRLARYPKTAFPTAEVYGPTPDPQLRLVTCGGELDRQRHGYADNVVVYAVLAQ